jgi:multiple sugar transport system permease protein
MVWRLVVRASMSVLLAAMFAGCQKRDERREIRFWVTGNNRGIEAVCREWERRNPGWRVITTVYNSMTDAQRLMTGIAGGDPPQIVMQDRFMIGEWASRGAFAALDDRLAAAGIRAEQFYPATWNEATYEGKTYAIPFDTDCRALYYVPSQLREAGLVDARGEPAPPRDWDELRRFAQALTRRDAAGRLVRLGFAPNYGNSWLYLYAWLNGGEMLSRDGRTVTMDQPEVVEALRYMATLYADAGGTAQVDAFVTATAGAALDPFLNQRVSMKIDGNWFLNVVAEFAPDLDLAVAPPPAPAGKQTTTWSGGFSFAIPATARYQDRAFDLIRFLVSDEGFEIFHETNQRYSASRGRGYIPQLAAQPAINERVMRERVRRDANLPPRIVQALQVFLDLMPQSRFRPVTPVGQFLWDQHVRAIEQTTRGGRDPQSVLSECRELVQSRLDRVLAEQVGAVNARVVRPRTMVLTTVAALLAFALGMSWWIRRRAVSARRDQLLAAGAFLSPWLIGFAVLTAGPIVASLLISFSRYDVLHEPEWVGLGNYERLVNDPLFWKSLLNTVYMLMAVPLGIVIGLGIAMLLNADIRGMKVFRTLFYLPAVVPVVASSVLWLWVLAPTNGLINTTLRLVGIENTPLWLSSPSWLLGSKAAMILMMLWGAGSGMIIWLAGLKGIPRHLYEAAAIDGCGPVRRFFAVTLPMLTPYIFFNLVMGVIGVMQLFTQALVMTQGGPADSTLFYALQLFNSGFRYFELGYASAMAWVLLVIVLTITLLQVYASRRWVTYDVT